jgi:hypothetical protein
MKTNKKVNQFKAKIGEIQSKFNISDSALNNIIKRNNLPKIRKGRYTYVKKTLIDKILS